MGGHIGDGFLEALSSANKADGVPAGRSKRFVRKDDDTMFEEEGGHPGKLSEGYVVVRRKDLR
jgi:hypothetical protein